MDKETLDLVNKGITDTLEKSLPEIVESTVSKKISELEAKSASELEEIKAELKKISMSARLTDPKAQSFTQKATVVGIFKDVMENSITTEKGFNEVVAKNIKAMTEGTSGEGAELVFDQFENDILKVINDYSIVNDVRILPLAKGDKISLPKATNGITTYFTDEGTNYTASEADTAFVVINIAKTTTLTDMTQELLDDTMTVPDLYNLIVEFIGESQAQFLETQILEGTGSVKGILANTSVNKIYLGSSKDADDIDDTVLVNVITTAARKYKRQTSQVKFYMSQYVFGKIQALKTTDGYPLYPEMRGATPKLMGYDVVLSDVGFVQNSTGNTAGEVCLLFGDLKYFTLCRRKGVTVERGYYGDNRKKDIQTLKSNARYGGTCTFPEAFTIVINGASA